MATAGGCGFPHADPASSTLELLAGRKGLPDEGVAGGILTKKTPRTLQSWGLSI